MLDYVVWCLCDSLGFLQKVECYFLCFRKVSLNLNYKDICNITCIYIIYIYIFLKVYIVSSTREVIVSYFL